MNTNNGWKLVPIEPTPEMVKAAFDQFEISAPGFATGNDARRAIYAAMLAAAPGTPPASAQEDAKEWGPAFDAWFAKRGVWPRVNYDEIFAAGWNARPVDAPAAGDALDSQAIAALRLALKDWEDRQQRYKNRSPAWVEAARAAIAQQSQRKEET